MSVRPSWGPRRPGTGERFHRCPVEELLEGQRQIRHSLAELNRKADIIMANQDDIDAAVAEDNTLIADLGIQVSQVQAAQAAFAAEIANLAAQGVDTSGLVAANDQLAAAQVPLDAAVASLTAASQPPAPAGS
jgi:hypothetical protein